MLTTSFENLLSGLPSRVTRVPFLTDIISQQLRNPEFINLNIKWRCKYMQIDMRLFTISLALLILLFSSRLSSLLARFMP